MDPERTKLTAPERIYLGYTSFWYETSEEGLHDIEYVRADLLTPAADSARLAAEEIANWLNWKQNIPQIAHEQNVVSLTNMLSKYLAAAPLNTGGLICDCCGRNCELRINGKFCNECAGYRAAAPADNDAESLLQHVAYSGVEFDDNRDR